MPNLYVIAGCNGAGKTTASKTILAELWNCKEFVNADIIAAELCASDPESVAIEAGRIMLRRIDELIEEGADFSIETTLATRSYVSLIRQAREKGYMITLLFLWLESPEMAIDRVATRVSKGGHNIPAEVIKRRYFRGINNFSNLYLEICDRWCVVNNIIEFPEVIAEGRLSFTMDVKNPELWRIFSKQSHRAEEPSAIYSTGFSNGIIASIRKAVYNLIVESAAMNESLVVGIPGGGFKHVPATELLEKLKKRHTIPPSPHDTPAPY